MSLPAFLLRLLLCLALVLNGSGYAVASTKMHLAHVTLAGQQHHDAGKIASPAKPPCHMPDGIAAQTKAHEHHPSASLHGKPDCCTTLCACDCLRHASLALTGLQHPVGWLAHAPSTRPVPAGHTEPVLANPIRPPIG